MYILGIVAKDIAPGEDGYVMFYGKLRGVNTLAYQDGQVLYASATTPGALTATEPGNGFLKLPIAFVVHAASNGVLAVRVTPGSYLRDQHDVDTSGRANNSVLRYSASLGYWKASTTAGIVAGDTASMLTNYINFTDTASMLSAYLRKADTLSLSNRINTKLNISDTTAMLSTYVNIADTAAMLATYINASDTASMLSSYLKTETPQQLSAFDAATNAAAVELSGPANAGEAIIVVDANNATPWDGFAVVGIVLQYQSRVIFTGQGGILVSTAASAYADTVRVAADTAEVLASKVWVQGRGYLTSEVDGSVTNELQSLTLSGQSLGVTSGSGVTLPVVNITAGTGIGVSSSSGNFTVTNASPDQTVAIAGGGITSVTGTYPNFTVSSTEVDGSTTNELQTISVATNTTTLSNGGGSMTIAGGGINTVGTAGTTITITGTEVDGSVTNEGSLTVGAGTATTSVINSNTSGSTGVTLTAGTGLSISENTGTGTITLTNASPDQTVSISGTGITVGGTYPSFTLTASDQSITNEGSLTVGAGTATTSVINSNTSGSTGVTLTAGTGLSIAESGNTITLSNVPGVKITSSGSTTTLSATSEYMQIYTGALAFGSIFDYRMPPANTLIKGQTFEFKNKSSGGTFMRVIDDAINQIVSIPPKMVAKVICIDNTTPESPLLRYNVVYEGSDSVSGYGNLIAETLPTLDAVTIINGVNVSSRLQLIGAFARKSPVTITASTYTVADDVTWIICDRSGSVTLTLPTASIWTGREIMVKTVTANTVISNASNVVPLAGGSAGTAILSATAGKWATLVFDGTNWVIMQAN
jgi:hypothetical protein